MVQSTESPATPGDQILEALITIGRATRKRLDASLDQGSYFLLHTLSRTGSVRASELAQACELDNSTVSRQLRQLTDNGLVERRPDPCDGRAHLVSLSDEGAEVTALARARKRALVLDQLAGWPEHDVTELARLLGLLAEQVSSGVPAPNPHRPTAPNHSPAAEEGSTR